MIVLGVHFEHDAGATLMRDGHIAINVEAERITGVKHAAGPESVQAAVKAAFDQSGIRPEEVSAIAFSDMFDNDPRQLDRLPEIQKHTHGPELVHSLGCLADAGLGDFLPSDVLNLRTDVPVFLVCHSVSHAAGAVYMAGFAESCGLVFDAYGTCCGMMGYSYKDGRLSRLDQWQDRYLMGAGYHRIGVISKEIDATSDFLDVAGKVMGLQAYGHPITDWVKYFEEVYFPSSAETGFDDYMRMRTAKSFCEGLFPGGLVRSSRSVDEGDYCNLVASMQEAFSNVVAGCVDRLIQETNLSNVFLSGGCAMNIISNTSVAELPRVASLFVPPNCGDTGQAMGAAIVAMRAMTGAPLHRPEISTKQRRDPYIGAELLDDPAAADLPFGIVRKRFDWHSPGHRVSLAQRLITGDIVGVISGRSEIGPRALGNRSILAHASFPDMKDRINHKVKHREWWRPFAPVCRLQDAPVYFENRSPDRYMLKNDVVLEQWREELSAITHADGTARVQILESREDNELLWDLLGEIAAQHAVPVLLNTSFNLSGKPLANTTAEAVELLANSEMDAVIVSDFLFEKQPALTFNR